MLHVAERNGWTRFVSMQNHYNLIYREEEREMIPFCISEGIGIVPWSPLARGFLAGNRSRTEKSGETARARTDDYAQQMYYAQHDFDVVDRVAALAKERAVMPAQIALAWILANDAVTSVIIGARRVSQLEDNLKSVEVALTPDDMKALDDASRLAVEYPAWMDALGSDRGPGERRY